ncbi:uncharacterized protein [Halyomorpha halys]|uniref:uncharacterized protein n=1 Tax=Halyomorpha halys TaxID=286706 RepID=UPI0006D5158E|nr:uncharacterized protein LOC106680490 [Halyomorpha halys]
MDLLKLLPILFVAGQGEARAIHQQLLPAIPGYVPVYIQQGPDVEVIYETGGKVAVHDSEKAAKPVEDAQQQKVGEEVQQEISKEEGAPVQESDEPRPLEPAKVAQDDKSTHEDHGLEEVPKKVGTGSAVLVPGYQAEPVASK